ncbi:hypothetical protein Bca4012_092431 [Brassica carinata]
MHNKLVTGKNIVYLVKKRLRFLYAIINKRPIDFGRRVYNQIIVGRKAVGFHNLIHLVLVHQPEITPLVGDEELIGKPMYLWRIPETSVPRYVSPQQLMYHNIDQAVRLIQLLQNHVLGVEVVNGDDDEEEGEDVQNTQE